MEVREGGERMKGERRGETRKGNTFLWTFYDLASLPPTFHLRSMGKLGVGGEGWSSGLGGLLEEKDVRKVVWSKGEVRNVANYMWAASVLNEGPHESWFKEIERKNSKLRRKILERGRAHEIGQIMWAGLSSNLEMGGFAEGVDERWEEVRAAGEERRRRKQYPPTTITNPRMSHPFPGRCSSLLARLLSLIADTRKGKGGGGGKRGGHDGVRVREDGHEGQEHFQGPLLWGG